LAHGENKVELLLENCKIVNVFNHNIQLGNIAIDNGKIIGIGDYQAKKTIDLKEKYVAPGLVDSHLHLESSLVSPEQFAKAVVPSGTTTVIADPHEIANVCGLAGIEYMMTSVKNSPINAFFMLPSSVPATPHDNSGAVLKAKDLKKMMSNDLVLGLGELMDFPSVLKGEREIIKKMEIANRKIIDGHGPGLKGKDLNAYMINGVKTDHECSTVEEMHERIERGMYVAIREGSAARDLEKLIPGVNEYNYRRCTFCTDDKNPEDILRDGHINYNIKKSIEMGIDPITAIQMATINPAECYNLRDIGAIAPGYDADLIVFDNFETFVIEKVYKKGKLMAEDGVSLFDVEHVADARVLNTVNVDPIEPNDLTINLTDDIVNVIRIFPFSLVTEKVVRRININEQNEYVNNSKLDIRKLAVVERHKNTGNIGLGLVENFGIQNGAIATTISHDSHNIICVGDNDEDMALAINQLIEMNGGIVIASANTIEYALALPIAGLMTDESLYYVRDQIKAMKDFSYQELKINEAIDPFMTLSFLSLSVIPAIKLTDEGLFDVNTSQYIGLNVN
jgi:adenine deaminase